MKNPDVMVIDDEVEICNLITTYLGEKGIKVVYTTTAEAAELMLAQYTPRLIFLDYNLPGKSGFDFLCEAKERGLKSKIVMLTAHADKQKIMEGVKLGCVEYIAKPFDIRQLAKDTLLWLEILDAT